MKTSTSVLIPGWRDTYAPCNINVKVADWLLDNGFSEEDAQAVGAGSTFADYATCLEDGLVDCSKIDAIADGWVDTFLRDAIFSAIDAIA